MIARPALWTAVFPGLRRTEGGHRRDAVLCPVDSSMASKQQSSHRSLVLSPSSFLPLKILQSFLAMFFVMSLPLHIHLLITMEGKQGTNGPLGTVTKQADASKGR